MTGEDYAANLALLSNRPVQIKSLLHRLEQAVGGIKLYVNPNRVHVF